MLQSCAENFLELHSSDGVGFVAVVVLGELECERYSAQSLPVRYARGFERTNFLDGYRVCRGMRTSCGTAMHLRDTSERREGYGTCERPENKSSEQHVAVASHF